MSFELPSNKRRRLDSGLSSPAAAGSATQAVEIYSDSASVESQDAGEQDQQSVDHANSKTVLSHERMLESQAALAKTGVIYLSWIPPRLSPTRLRQLLSPFGSPVLRIFLAPESPAVYNRRVKFGGSRKKHFSEGWVEFEDKTVAKKVAKLLNAERIGSKKGDVLYDDLWCIKYLPKFKWHHLTEQRGISSSNAALMS
jgi:ESF2/ABP1 family protein